LHANFVNLLLISFRNFKQIETFYLMIRMAACVPVMSQQNHSAVSLPLVHRHGPCAPSISPDKPPSFADTLRRSRPHMNHLANMGSPHGDDEKAAGIPTHLGSSVKSLEYVVTVSFGTPVVPRVVVVDTGSDLSWLQCKPCSPSECSQQKDPLFDPSRSSTYDAVACGTAPCRKLAAGCCCAAGKQ
jgi:hypothetical protein